MDLETSLEAQEPTVWTTDDLEESVEEAFEIPASEFEAFKATKAQKLNSLAEAIRGRLRNDWDVVISVCGVEGVGKSTFAIQLAKRICRPEPGFSIENNVIFNPTAQEVTTKVLKTLDQYSATVFDEAINISYKRTWAKSSQIELNRIMHIWRKRNIAAIFCMPYFNDFDSYLRKSRIFLNFNVIDRGCAVCFVRMSTPFGNDDDDPWFLRDNVSTVLKGSRGRAFETLSTRKKINILQKCVGYQDVYFYSELSSNDQSKYDALAARVQQDIEARQHEEKPESKAKQKLDLVLNKALRYIKAEKNLNYKQMERELGLSSSSIADRINKVEKESPKPKMFEGVKVR